MIQYFCTLHTIQSCYSIIWLYSSLCPLPILPIPPTSSPLATTSSNSGILTYFVFDICFWMGLKGAEFHKLLMTQIYLYCVTGHKNPGSAHSSVLQIWAPSYGFIGKTSVSICYRMWKMINALELALDFELWIGSQLWSHLYRRKMDNFLFPLGIGPLKSWLTVG